MIGIRLNVTLVDTADAYGFGHSEELIASIIKDRGKGSVIIATKAGNDFYNATADDDKGYGAITQTYTKNYLIFAVEKSLKRLNLETLDILQLHSPDLIQLENDEPWLALEKLKKDGKIEPLFDHYRDQSKAQISLRFHIPSSMSDSDPWS